MTALWPFVLLTLTMFTCLGLILAPAFLTAMEPFGAVAGRRGGARRPAGIHSQLGHDVLLGLAEDGTARPMVVFLALAAACALAGWSTMARTQPGTFTEASTTPLLLRRILICGRMTVCSEELRYAEVATGWR